MFQCITLLSYIIIFPCIRPQASAVVLVIKVTSEAFQGQRSDTCGGCHPGPQGPAGTLAVLLTGYKTGIPRLWTGWCWHLRENRGGDTNGLGGQKGKGLHWVGRNSKESNQWVNEQTTAAAAAGVWHVDVCSPYITSAHVAGVATGHVLTRAALSSGPSVKVGLFLIPKVYRLRPYVSSFPCPVTSPHFNSRPPGSLVVKSLLVSFSTVLLRSTV